MIEGLFPPPVVGVEATDADWTGALLPEEEDRVRGATDKRRREFTAGRRCARQALARLGLAPAPLLPGPDRVPVWPEGAVGSISHTRGFCAAVVARSDAVRSLGLDAERAGPLDARLVRRVLTPAERTRFAGRPPPAGADWAKLAFSAKEAVYKCYYPLVRRALGFHDLELDFEPQVGRFSALLIRDAAPSAAGRRVFAGRFSVAGGYVLTGVTLA